MDFDDVALRQRDEALGRVDHQVLSQLLLLLMWTRRIGEVTQR